MSIPEALEGNQWTQVTARYALPIVVWCAKRGHPIQYGQLDAEIVLRGLGHRVLAVQYGHPAGVIGNALIELEDRWGEKIPPLNSIIVNRKDGLPGEGVDFYLRRYYKPKKDIAEITPSNKRAIVEEIHADVFAYKKWDAVLKACGLQKIKGIVALNLEEVDIDPPKRGGWSSEPESPEHLRLKTYVANNPSVVGLPRSARRGQPEYRFASADCADVVFKTGNSFLAVEVKSRISNEHDLNRGIFQAVKYQALLRAEQRARREAPTATAVLVTEKGLSVKLRNLANILGISVFKVVPLDA